MKGELIEIVNGIEIRKKPSAESDPLALVAGRRGRLTASGPIYEVDRIGQGAAYLHKVHDPPLERPIGPWPELNEVADKLVAAIKRSLVDKDAIARAVGYAKEAAHIAKECRRILVSRGPVEPGISRSARFAERVE